MSYHQLLSRPRLPTRTSVWSLWIAIGGPRAFCFLSPWLLLLIFSPHGIPHFIHSCVDGHLGCLHFFGHYKSGFCYPLSTSLVLDVCFHFSWVTPRSEMTSFVWLCGRNKTNLLRNFQTVSQSGCGIFQLAAACRRIPMLILQTLGVCGVASLTFWPLGYTCTSLQWGFTFPNG